MNVAQPPSKPRPAATVLLLRDSRGELEVLMMQRAGSVAFLGGMWVFPGGRVDSADSSRRALARVAQPAAAECFARVGCGALPVESLEDAVGLYVAACRETFEESGALLTKRAGVSRYEAAGTESLQATREEITRDPGRFISMLEEQDLFIDAESFVYWSRWITPSLEKKRFDTHFFATAINPDQQISADLSELTRHEWVTPLEALAAAELGKMNMVPPTLLTLEDLHESYTRHGDLNRMLDAERNRSAPPVMPRIAVDREAFRVVMPWDPGYPAIEGEGISLEPDSIPAHLANRRSSVAISRSLRTGAKKKPRAK